LLPVADTMKFSGAFTAPRRTPRADIRENNRAPGFFSRFSTTQLGGMAIGVTLEYTGADRSLVGHVVMGMAAHSHRDLICGAQGMRCAAASGATCPPSP
jgi:hypothetical protein